MSDLPKKNILSMQIDVSKFQPVTKEEIESIATMPESKTMFQIAMKKLFKDPLAIFSIALLGLLLIVLILSPIICPYNYKQIITVNGQRDATARNLSPFQYSPNEKAAMAQGQKIFPHIFGTDELCRDYFARVIAGTQISLFIGIFASLIVLIIGTIYGSIAGLVGGWTDTIMMRIVDVIYSLPDMLIIILLSVVLGAILPKNAAGLLGTLGPNMISMFIVFALLYWVGMARLVRGQILSIRENDYILAANLINTPKSRIIRKHIIPNCLSMIFISVALEVPTAIFTESFLSFVGLGVKAPMPSLGALSNAARNGMELYPYKLVIPAIMIAIIVLCFNLLGNSLRDAFDPKS